MFKRQVVYIIGIIFIVVLSLRCSEERKKEKKEKEVVAVNDFQIIKDRGSLTLLTENSSTSYFLYKGQPIGYDYELVSEFCDFHDLDLEVVIVDDLEEMFDDLSRGVGDVIALNLAITQERSQKVNYSTPVMDITQVLVQKKPKNWRSLSRKSIQDSVITDLYDLDGKRVSVHVYSSFHQRLLNLEEELGIDILIDTISGSIDSEQMIEFVREGKIELTVADDNLAKLNANYYPELYVSTEISTPQKVGWAVSKNSDSLLVAINEWLEKREVKRFNAELQNKYFKYLKSHKRKVQSQFSSLGGGKISIYDDFLKEQSTVIDWDWKMLSALIKKESSFDPSSKSWAGAFGLMQLMPQTAIGFGGDTLDTEYGNIKTGIKYIKSLEKYWAKRIEDKDERVKFVLASYNTGLGHVMDAQIITEMEGGNPLIWKGEVEMGMKKKAVKEYYQMEEIKHGYCRGEDVVDYVDRVLEFYEHFRNI